MNNSDNIQKEIQDYDSFVEELRRISVEIVGSLRSVSKDLENGEKEYKIFAKDYIVNNGIPKASLEEINSICSFIESERDLSKISEYLSEELINDQMRLATLSLAVSYSIEFYHKITLPSFSCILKRMPKYFIIQDRDFTNNCIDIEEFTTIITQHLKGGALRNIFKQLTQIKTVLAVFMQILFGNNDENDLQNDETDEELNVVFFELNSLFDSIQDENYELFKETVNRIGTSDFYKLYAFLSKYIPMFYLFEDIDKIEKMDSNTFKKYLVVRGLDFNVEQINESLYHRNVIYYDNLYLYIIDNRLPSEAKETIEAFWEDSGLSWFKDPWKVWLKEELQLISENVSNKNKKSKTRGKTKIDHLNVPCSPKMIRTIATGFVEGNNSPYLPKHLISSKAGDNVAVNQLIYLFNGETDTVSKPSYSLEWNKNYNLNGLRLLIYLLHFKGEFEDNDPLNALDDNDETSKDGISEVVKFKNTGRRSIFPIVEKAFCTGDKSVQNAKKPKGGNREFLEQIIKFWWYCKNSDTAATE